MFLLKEFHAHEREVGVVGDRDPELIRYYLGLTFLRADRFGVKLSLSFRTHYVYMELCEPIHPDFKTFLPSAGWVEDQREENTWRLRDY